VHSLSRLREVGERVSPQWDNPQDERALARRFAPTSEVNNPRQSILPKANPL